MWIQVVATWQCTRIMTVALCACAETLRETEFAYWKCLKWKTGVCSHLLLNHISFRAFAEWEKMKSTTI